MTRWVMVADSKGASTSTCTAACRHANATSPAVQWRKVLDIEAGAYPNVNHTSVPVGCQHCADPPCMHVCPSTATRQRADGIVPIDYDICIGCAYCDVACPYQARFKITMQHFAYGAEAMQNEIEREISERLGWRRNARSVRTVSISASTTAWRRASVPARRRPASTLASPTRCISAISRTRQQRLAALTRAQEFSHACGAETEPGFFSL